MQERLGGSGVFCVRRNEPHDFNRRRNISRQSPNHVDALRHVVADFGAQEDIGLALGDRLRPTELYFRLHLVGDAELLQDLHGLMPERALRGFYDRDGLGSEKRPLNGCSRGDVGLGGALTNAERQDKSRESCRAAGKGANMIDTSDSRPRATNCLVP